MIRVALHHLSTYRYDRTVNLGPQIVRLRPAPHCRTPVRSYSLSVSPNRHFINWQQDPHSNYLSRLVFQEPTQLFQVEVNLIAEMTVINPFDFFLEPQATTFPFEYAESLTRDLAPFRAHNAEGPRFAALLDTVDRREQRTIDFLVDLNRLVHQQVSYVIRLEPGVQTPEETLSLGRGSCRDSAWLLAQLLRHLGLAARFVSGYLIQLKADVASLDGPSGPGEDFTDLHAWTEVFLPGAGWVGLDPTSGLLAGEGHIPLAATPEPTSAAPISGMVDECEVEFGHEMSVTRIHEDPRVTKPYREEQWEQITRLGHEVDKRLNESDVRLTMGGEPTFVSVDDMEGDEWKTAAVGPDKERLAAKLIRRLQQRFAPGGLLHYGHGKWYPGEPLPRFAYICLWRRDGEPVWRDHSLLADPHVDLGQTYHHAEEFARSLAERLRVNARFAIPAYEDALYYLWKEHRLPVNAELQAESLDDDGSRARLARVLDRGLKSPVGYVLPLAHHWREGKSGWMSGRWPVRAEHMFLIPGDSPMGLRLPLDSLPPRAKYDFAAEAQIPFAAGEELPAYETLRQRAEFRRVLDGGTSVVRHQVLAHVGSGNGFAAPASEDAPVDRPTETWDVEENGHVFETGIIRTALCVEPRQGTLRVFMPPVERLEHYLNLVAAIEETSDALEMPIVIEGYLPPADYRLQRLSTTPDPGVIEVNIHPASSWNELVDITSGLYEDARQTRLGTEKFDADGTHTGTGGGNHLVVGGPTPSDSPFLRRPDLLRSLLGYWHNHPSLSYLFSSRFVGPTSQAPRLDEGRRDAIYELQIAFEQIPDNQPCPPWLVDRVFRHLLVDLTGNTHRAEICIDKLYSPDGATGRLGLVEFRAFEMPPHWKMSLTQQLLLRSLIARFWEHPYQERLIDWDTTVHDRWMLPHFVQHDFVDIIDEQNACGFPLQVDWFAPHFEFRFPVIGEFQQRGIHVELRTAVEPWYVLGEEPAGGYTARYVDSSMERLQVKVQGMYGGRHEITCNGRRLPLHPTGKECEYVAGVRYRAWQPPSCLHPTIPVDEPLVFDIRDTWLNRSLGGCRYHVGHPGGLNPPELPVNAFESESRRAARFSRLGHSPGPLPPPEEVPNHAFPLTLDLRLGKGNTRRNG
ncbi:MAG: transglutaminase family protein [Planctomycetales bacterium]|nr:transglutaminase family protein [Planctomycetales bacterium]